MARHYAGQVLIELTWTCSSCKTSNKGFTKSCVSCGNPKEDDKEEEDLDPTQLNSRIISSQEDKNKALAGADWACQYCGSLVENNIKTCKNCISNRDKVTEPKRKNYEPGYLPKQNPIPQQSYSLPDNKAKINPVVFISAILSGILLLSGIVWLFIPHEVNAKITNIEWVRKSEFKIRQINHDSDWKKNMQSDAYSVSCQDKQSGTHNCHPYECNRHNEPYDCNPYKCNPQQTTEKYNRHDCNCRVDYSSCRKLGNGSASCSQTCETCYDTRQVTTYSTCYKTCDKWVTDTCYEQCPTIEPYCSYSYDTWPTVKEEELSGYNHEIKSTNFIVKNKDERVITNVKFNVIFVKQDKSWKFNPSSSTEFNNFYKDDIWLIKVNHLNFVTPVSKIMSEQEK